MAFTDERILELSSRYGKIGINEEGASISLLDATNIKVYQATYSTLTTEQKNIKYLTDDNTIWAGSTRITGLDIFEVLFESAVELKDAENKYLEVRE